MLIRRCAWHREYRGHGLLLGVASLRGWGIRYSDGMCSACARRAREEWHIPPAPESPSRLQFPLAALAASTAVLLVVLQATGALHERPQPSAAPVSTAGLVAVRRPVGPPRVSWVEPPGDRDDEVLARVAPDAGGTPPVPGPRVVEAPVFSSELVAEAEGVVPLARPQPAAPHVAMMQPAPALGVLQAP